MAKVLRTGKLDIVIHGRSQTLGEDETRKWDFAFSVRNYNGVKLVAEPSLQEIIYSPPTAAETFRTDMTRSYLGTFFTLLWMSIVFYNAMVPCT
jgi:hypothetical protein